MSEEEKKKGLIRGFIDYAARTSEEGLGHGPYGAESDSHVDAKPYVEYWQNGLFEGYDGSIWKYYKFPNDVQTEWLKKPENAIYNQQFFVDAITEFGKFLDGQLEKVRDDIRRPFHIQITQSESKGVRLPSPEEDREGKVTQKTRDYFKRMKDQYRRPIWHQYMGVRLLPGTLFGDAFGITEKVRRYIELITNPGEIDLASMSRDLADVDNIMYGAGFTELDFVNNPEDFEQLTAWYGVSDSQYGLTRSLQTARMREPLSGMSVITPKYGEIQLFALKPREGINLKDPLDPNAAWAKPLYRPTSDVVMISIRGQVRAPKIAENLLDLKNLKKTEAGRRLGDTSTHEVAGMISDLDAIERARYAINEYKLPMLDNLEIVMATKVRGEGETNPLFNSLKSYDMEAHLLVGRQPLGIMASIPTYPRQTLRVPRGNNKRPELSNVMLPGMLAMSGLFRSTKPCANFGILVGLATAGHSYDEIMTEVDGAAKNNRVPGFLITGRPGSGKALSLDTPIMTPDGCVTMGEIKVGDRVFGSDGKIANVTFVTEVMDNHEVFRVTLSDGQEFLADADHQWIVMTGSDRYYYKSRSEEAVQASLMRSRQQESALLRIAESYDPQEKVTRKQILNRIKDVFGVETPWSSVQSIRYALGFNDVPFEVVDSRGTAMYNAKQAFEGLALRTRQSRTYDSELGKKTRRMTTGEMFANGVSKVMADGDTSWRYAIPVAQEVTYEEKSLPIDPYILGMWLGDGSADRGQIASGDVGMSVDNDGLSDQKQLVVELMERGYDDVAHKTGREEYVVGSAKLRSELKAAGLLNNKHIPHEYMTSSVEQRRELLRGLLDSDGWVDKKGAAHFGNTDSELIEQVTKLVRSLGIKTHQARRYRADRGVSPKFVGGREVVGKKDNYEISFVANFPLFRIARKLERQNLSPSMRTQSIFIRSIERVDSVPVRCISVDSADHTYLIGDSVVTSNTQSLLQYTTQIANMGLPVAFFNPKKEGTLKPTFDHIHGITISMERQYLEQNPGLLDPMFFLKNRGEVAELLADAVFMANRMYDDKGSAAAQRRTKVQSEIRERALNTANKTSQDIIFGNAQAGTTPLSDVDIVNFIRDKVQISPFWRAFIAPSDATSELQKQISSGASFLMEWGSSMRLPDSSKIPADYTDPEIDTVLSINVSFKYAAEVVGGGQGGAIIVDESWVLKNSKEAMAILTKGGREWRQANIMLILATQRILDWIDAKSEKSGGSGAANMSSYFDRYLFMAINEADENELEMYFEMTGLPDTEANRRWIIEAGPGKGGSKLPNGYYIDNIYNWAGGLVCGPWPEYELNLGRTDKAGLAAKQKMEVSKAQESFNKAASAGGYGGALLDVLSGDSSLTADFEDDQA